jgi:hypothetical protein
MRSAAAGARLKKELALAKARIEEIIAQPPESAKTAKVYDLLLAAAEDRPRQGDPLPHPLSNRALEDGRRIERTPTPRTDGLLDR